MKRSGSGHHGFRVSFGCAMYECFDPCSGEWKTGPFFNAPGSHPSDDHLCRCITPIIILPGIYY